MKNIVILAVNAKYIHSSLSVWVLADGISRYAKTPVNARVVETAINQSHEEIAAQVTTSVPDVVGISAYIWNASKLPDIIATISSRLPEAVIILGGPEATHNAPYWIDNGADFVLRGDGERSFPALLDALYGNGNSHYESLPETNTFDSRFMAIPGLCMKHNGIPVFNPDMGYINDFHNPDSKEYYDALGGRIAYIETSRGCPFSCSFCLSGGCDISSGSVRYLPTDTVKEQLRKLSETQTQTIKLVDRTFNCNPTRAFELFEYVINLETTSRFHFEVAPDLFDTQTLSLLSKAPLGRIQLEAGIQSFHKPALKASNRQTDLEKASENIREIVRNGNIHVHVDLIAGLPYETLPDVQNSFDCAYALGAHTLQLGRLKLLHGSVIRRQAAELGIIFSKEPPYEIISSPWLSECDFEIIMQAENALRHTYNKGRFLSALQYSLIGTGLSPFILYRTLGESLPRHSTAPGIIAALMFDCISALPGIDTDTLREHMICDWLSVFKGVNMPSFLTADIRLNTAAHRQRKHLSVIAKKKLGHNVTRFEIALLPSNRGIFTDSADRDPVTGLYKLHYHEISVNSY